MLEGLSRSVYTSLAWARKRPLRAFLLLTFAFSWGDWFTLLASGGQLLPGRFPTDLVGMAGPAFAAFAVTAMEGREESLKDLAYRIVRFPLRDPWPWLLGPTPLVALLAVLVYRDLTGATVPPLVAFTRYPGLPDMHVLVTFDVVLVAVGFGQEIGWRGLALPRLQERFGPLTGALAVAIPWGVWLLPLILLDRTGPPADLAAALGSMALLLVSSSLLLAFLVARAGGGLAFAATWHACLRFATGTPGARDGVAGQVTLVIATCAALLLVAELRARKRGSTLLVSATSRKT